MKVEDFIEVIGEIIEADFYIGVPDSQLRALCDYLMDTRGTDPRRHVIAANEGNAVALAAGCYLATGRVPVVYLQNSGEGNIINPVASLLNERVYAIPVLFIVGWRGEPGGHDEPQHVYQGQVTLKLLEDMDITPFVVGQDTGLEEVRAAMGTFRELFARGRSAAFVVRKGALTYGGTVAYSNDYTMRREEVIRRIVRASQGDLIVCTTGKASRELFEIREAEGQGHQRDFLTVGSMGHCSSIALGLALHAPERRVWCVDGDGAALMHLGALAVIGTSAPKNLIHIIINNSAHESVGGMPTAAGGVDLAAVARACGYPRAVSVADFDGLDRELGAAVRREGPSLIEARCAIGARANLGRPTTTALENKRSFMQYLDA